MSVGTTPDDDVDPSGGFELEELESTPDVCPVDLAEIVVDAGLTVSDPLEVSVASAPTSIADLPIDPPPPSVVDVEEGIYFECEQPVDDGTVSLLLYLGGPEGAAEAAFLPVIQARLQLPTRDLEEVLDRIDATDPGEVVDLHELGEGLLAVARIDVEGTSGVIVMIASDDLELTSNDLAVILREVLTPSS
jgi:hypothetical protein